jgi:hypothetical protein
MEMSIVRSLRYEIDEIGSSDLLERCRNPSEPADQEVLPQPVWLKKISSDDFQVLWTPPGMSGSVHECIVVDDDRPDWLLTLKLWNRYGGPGPVETGQIICFIDDKLSDSPRMVSRALEVLDLPNSSEVLDGFRSLVNLPEFLRFQLRDGNLSPRLFRYLQRVPDPLRPSIIDLLSEHPRVFSVQEMRQVADAIRRIPESNYDQFRELLESVPYNNDQDSVESSAIIDFTRELAYPEITSRENDFAREMNSLNLDGRITVKPPKNFEGAYLEFSFRCARDEDLEALAEEVKKCRTLLKHV